MDLRQWQAEALDVYRQVLEQERRSMLCEATPGAGKTAFALTVARHQRQEARRRVAAVVPTRHLKKQWAKAAARLDLQLDPRFDGVFRRDYQGVVVTYQQAATDPEFYTDFCRGGLLVLDEIHHAGDGLTWGDAIQAMAQDAGFALALTGTAFRTDDCQIPFLQYRENGVSQPDYTYSYTQALQDGVCRPVGFFTYDGEVSWTVDDDDELVQAAFSDHGFQHPARRLRVALDPGSGWIQKLLLDAHDMLMGLRVREQADAGGLIVCYSQAHARRVAGCLAELTGDEPVVALSDDAESSGRIKNFADSDRPWIVACNMVSEGVDIPRLRVGVYATTVTTRMYFRQFLGRITRRTSFPNGLQVAYCYLPADTHILHLAHEVEREQRHVILERPEDDGGEAGEYEMVVRQLKPSDDGRVRFKGAIANGRQLSFFDDMDVARQVVEQEFAARFAPEQEPVVMVSDTRDALLQEVRRLAGLLHFQTQEPFSAIYGRLNSMQRVQSQGDCDVAQLRQRVAILSNWLS